SDVGISTYHSNNNTITDNTVNSNDCGIRMEMSRDNTLQNNIANSNEGDGIYLSMFSDDNVFTNNTANSNDCGIRMRQSNNNTFTKNTVSSNDYGIRLYQSNNNSITCNGVCNNAQRGLHLFLFSRDNNISYNNIIANGAQQANGSYQWQFDNAQTNSVVAENNYWGTADGSIIAASTMGDVDCEPFETVACPCAPTPELPTSRPPIYVGPGETNTTIQGAVNNATSGDTIIVRDGTYNENVDVDVAHLTIRSENGSANCFVNASDPNDSVFRMIVNYVDISGFTVENATGDDAAGIYLGLNANHCNISGNTVANNNVGIHLYISPDNTLQNNIVNLNEKDGIYMGQADRNILRDNIVNSNTGIGISIDHSDDIILRNNIANSNNYGIYMGYTVRSVLLNNTANSNNESGINMDHSNNNTLRKNTVNSNDCGVYMAYASNNNITCNVMYNNTGAGVYLESGNIANNISCNNIIANGDCNATTGGWEWQFVNDQLNDVEAGHNYWGAGMNNTTIDASIRDDEEGISGEVKFYPFETEPVTCAPTHEETPAFTTTDAAIALQIAVGNREYGSRWDVNSDGRVTSLDALMILQAATGKWQFVNDR
ncbi:MAG: NosD domain-containing protein, partial [Euryarchaeota archaeon]|nr:NosD domain-containing protein [Euryarchaeota archaeon]